MGHDDAGMWRPLEPEEKVIEGDLVRGGKVAIRGHNEWRPSQNWKQGMLSGQQSVNCEYRRLVEVEPAVPEPTPLSDHMLSEDSYVAVKNVVVLRAVKVMLRDLMLVNEEMEEILDWLNRLIEVAEHQVEAGMEAGHRDRELKEASE